MQFKNFPDTRRGFFFRRVFFISWIPNTTKLVAMMSTEKTACFHRLRKMPEAIADSHRQHIGEIKYPFETKLDCVINPMRRPFSFSLLFSLWLFLKNENSALAYFIGDYC